MRLENIGPLGLLNRFRDDWIVTRLAMRLFFLSTIIVLVLMPIVYGWINPKRISVWANLGWGLLGIVGPVALFFLLLGMWRYWLRIDDSGRWSKRFWFVMLLIGVWWWYALCLYCWIVYLPKVIRRNRIAIKEETVSVGFYPGPKNTTYTPGIFGKVLISCWVLFFGSLVATLLLLKPGKLPDWLPSVESLRFFMILLVVTSIVYGIRWLYRLGMKR